MYVYNVHKINMIIDHNDIMVIARLFKSILFTLFTYSVQTHT